MTSVRSGLTSATFRALAATWRVDVEDVRYHDEVAPGPFVYALWHHTLLPLLWWHRHRDITLLVSGHRDGALLAAAARGLGYRTARGSSTRGGIEGARAVLRDLADGRVAAITPDGPRGPARQVKPGILRIAQRAGVPILPVAAVADRGWRLGSWDRLLIPQPFARVRIRYGTPLHPGATSADRLGDLMARALDLLAGPDRLEAA